MFFLHRTNRLGFVKETHFISSELEYVVFIHHADELNAPKTLKLVILCVV